MSIRVVVVDDRPDIVAEMSDRIERAADGFLKEAPEQLGGKKLRVALNGLLARADNFAREGWSPRSYDSVFDTADVLVLDYDLRGLEETSAYLTGEDIARIARLYTRAKVILSVNRFGPPKFDLRLRHSLSAWADLNIAHEDLANRGLWINSKAEYRPWYWPVLSKLPGLFERRVEFAYRHRRKAIADALGFPSISLQMMRPEVYDTLPDPRETSFLDLAADHLLNPRAPRPPAKQLIRAASAAVGKWLMETVLPDQETLIDAPHLASMYPSVLDGRPTRSNLNRLCDVGVDVDIPIRRQMLKTSSFQPTYWLDRPVWWTESILGNDGIVENREPWTKVSLKYVFAEDSSQFISVADAKAFRSEGLFKTRYVRGLAPAYTPRSRLIA